MYGLSPNYNDLNYNHIKTLLLVFKNLFSKKEFVQVTEITVAEFGTDDFEVENGVDFQREMRNFNQCNIDSDGRLSLVLGSIKCKILSFFLCNF